MELRVPSFGESINEVLIGEWLKSEGETVALDEALVVIETDKITSELPSPVAGTLGKVIKGAGETAQVDEVIAELIEAGAKATASAAAHSAPTAPATVGGDGDVPVVDRAGGTETGAGEARAESDETRVMPAARRLLEEHGLNVEAVKASGPGGRLLKEDVQRHLQEHGNGSTGSGVAAPDAGAATVAPAKQATPAASPQTFSTESSSEREEEVVPMSPLRQKVAEHLLAAQRDAALLTTFNEIDMGAVMSLRRGHQDAFRERHGIKLGFMSFFVKAAVEALKLVPAVNAALRGKDIVYRNYFDIGIAVGGGRGLVVPIIRNAERLGFAEVELAIADYAQRAKSNHLKLEELQGGTFTISNGGIYGSMLSTPIVNAPQSGILGLHAIQDRPAVREGEVVVRPMMYVALSYDHRLIDGREAVTFLKHIKECVEEPARILLEI